MSKPNKDVILTIRIPEKEKLQLIQQAKDEGVVFSAFLRNRLMAPSVSVSSENTVADSVEVTPAVWEVTPRTSTPGWRIIWPDLAPRLEAGDQDAFEEYSTLLAGRKPMPSEFNSLDLKEQIVWLTRDRPL